MATLSGCWNICLNKVAWTCLRINGSQRSWKLIWKCGGNVAIKLTSYWFIRSFIAHSHDRCIIFCNFLPVCYIRNLITYNIGSLFWVFLLMFTRCKPACSILLGLCFYDSSFCYSILVMLSSVIRWLNGLGRQFACWKFTASICVARLKQNIWLVKNRNAKNVISLAKLSMFQQGRGSFS